MLLRKGRSASLLCCCLAGCHTGFFLMIYAILITILLCSLISETVRMMLVCPHQLNNYRFIKNNITRFSVDKTSSTPDVLFFTWKTEKELYVIAIRKYNCSCVAFESNTGELLIDGRWENHWCELLEDLHKGV